MIDVVNVSSDFIGGFGADHRTCFGETGRAYVGFEAGPLCL